VALKYYVVTILYLNHTCIIRERGSILYLGMANIWPQKLQKSKASMQID